MTARTITFQRDIAQEIRQKHDVTLREARDIMDTVQRLLVDTLHDGGCVRLGEIGVLMPVLVKARKRYHQVTGKTYDAPEHRTVKLRLSPGFKGRVAKGKKKVVSRLRNPSPGSIQVSKGSTSLAKDLRAKRNKKA